MKKSLVVLITTAALLSAQIPILAAPATQSLDITVHKAASKPVIDGKVTDAEWGAAVMYQAPDIGYTYFPDAGSTTADYGVEATIYMLWDEEAFYLAAVVMDTNHFNQYSGLDIWNGDSFEFDSNFNHDDYTDRNRQTIGLNNDGQIHGGSYKVAQGVDWPENVTEPQFSEYTIKREGRNTIYEIIIPWKNFCPTGADFAKEGNTFRGNVQFLLATDGDYLGSQRYVVYDAKTETSTYPSFILAGMEKPIAADEETTSPATSDRNLAFGILAILVSSTTAFGLIKKSKYTV